MSTPTVSRFEGGDKNIQLTSALAILDVLGLVERPVIEFPDKIERVDFDRDIVLFPARTPEGEVTCAIGGEALEDHFEARGISERALLAAFRAHRAEIEELARQQFLARRRLADGTVLIRTEDVKN